jgi:hypothetical protein
MIAAFEAGPAEIDSKHTKQKRSVATRLLKTVSMGWSAWVQEEPKRYHDFVRRNEFSLRALETHLFSTEACSIALSWGSATNAN